MQPPAKLLNRNFVLLWQGQAVSQLGSHISTIAMVFWLKQNTESGSLIGLMMMAGSIPRVILGGVAGAVADRYPRRDIIIYSDVSRTILALLLAIVLYTMPNNPDQVILWIIVTAVGLAVTDSFFSPAIAAAIPDVVPVADVVKANTLRQLTGQLAQFVGQGVGGTLFLVLGAPLIVLINALSFLFSAVSEIFMRIPQSIPTSSTSWRGLATDLKADFIVGVRYVWTHPVLKTVLAAVALFIFFTMPIIVLLPFYVENYLEISLDWYGIFLAVYGAGIALGALGAGFVKLPKQTRAPVIMVFITVNSFTATLFTLLGSPFAAMALTFASGVLSGFTNICFATILQLTTPTEIRGRVLGFLHSVGSAMATLGMALGGVVFDLIGQSIPVIFVSCSGIMIVLSIALSMNKGVRVFLARQD